MARVGDCPGSRQQCPKAWGMENRRLLPPTPSKQEAPDSPTPNLTPGQLLQRPQVIPTAACPLSRARPGAAGEQHSTLWAILRGSERPPLGLG